MLLSSLTAIPGLTAVTNFFSQVLPSTKAYINQFVTAGRGSTPHSCTVTWESHQPDTVGNVITFQVRLFHKDGSPCVVSGESSLTLEILHQHVTMAPSLELSRDDVNLVTCSFLAHKAGEYRVSVLVNGCHVSGSPVVLSCQAGPIDPSMSGFICHMPMVVVPLCTSFPFVIEPRDKFDNPAEYRLGGKDFFKITIQEAGTRDWYSPTTQFVYNSQEKRLVMHVRMDRKGCYQALVTYGNTPLKNGEFHILVLDSSELKRVQKLVTTNHQTLSFPATLLTADNQTLDKPKKVHVHMSPQKVTIQENCVKFCPRKRCHFHMCPSTQFVFHGVTSPSDDVTFSLDDGRGTSVQLASGDSQIMAAVYSYFLRNRLGGCSTFSSKQEFFYRQIRAMCGKKSGSSLTLRIDRSQLLKSSYKATRHLTKTDWCRRFEVVFSGEEALDWGGVSREWIELLCQELFDPKCSPLFTRFTDSCQGLVHPNAKKSPNKKIKLYEFAGKIVAKCLYESALGRRQLVKSRFTRSFLAQLIGVKVTYKHFETDNPEFYATKVSYIENNDVDNMGLTFSEEVYDTQGQLVKVADLIPNGHQTAVTNSNKLRYLDALAQQRLVTPVKDEVSSFLRGFSAHISRDLLLIFHEHELELLLCGRGTYNVAEFQLHCCVSGVSPSFSKVLSWFWTIVACFTDDLMARLLQFTTGSSLLPAGGFSELSPRIHLSPGTVYNGLPTSHTCFNQLCLPDCDNIETFHKLLLLAITECNQGFELV